MSPKVYFKNLHGFRFLAAALVIASHVELFKRRMGIKNAWDNKFFFEAGSAGVDFFFVLSGFLITTLLLSEMKYEGKVDIKKFYMRRILRIWPLYYLVLIVCYCIVPYLSVFNIPGYSEHIQMDFWPKFLLSFFFMPNAALAFFEHIPYAAPLWSVGVEEQFYLFWPLLIVATKKTLRNILLFIFLLIALKGGIVFLGRFGQDGAIWERVKDFFVATRMECMGIGALGAYLVYSNRFKYALSSNYAALGAILLLPLVFIHAQSLMGFHHLVFSVLFLFIIINGAINTRTFIRLENPILNWLGNISYGLYLWHCLCIGFVLNTLLTTGIKMEGVFFNLILYFITFLVSILVSSLSYKYFELFFLERKKKFTVVYSGNEAKEAQVGYERINSEMTINDERQAI